ncbi:MAG: hypothetical protein C0494_10490 [Sphingobium sp.]|jgi:hypothetical protein|nr:hypothetical protein [Sphingobium sp.]
MDDRIIAVGFLTQRDIDMLGDGFKRHFPIEYEDMFADLVARLNDVPFPKRSLHTWDISRKQK